MIVGSAVAATSRLAQLGQLCGHVAPIAAIGLYLAPLPTIHSICKKQSVNDFPLLPYTSIISATSVCATYGLLRGQPQVWKSMSVGLGLGLYYFMQFIRFLPSSRQETNNNNVVASSPSLDTKVSTTTPATTKEGTRISANKHISAIAIIFSICAVCAMTRRTALLGNLGIVLCMITFASPLVSLSTVWKTKSAKSIPLSFTMASVIKTFLWCMTGIFVLQDFAIWFPNVMGFSFGLTQIVLKLIYGNGNRYKQQQQLLPAVEGKVSLATEIESTETSSIFTITTPSPENYTLSLAPVRPRRTKTRALKY